MTNYMGTIAIACCDGKKVKLARLALFTMSLLLYLSDVYYKVSSGLHIHFSFFNYDSFAIIEDKLL